MEEKYTYLTLIKAGIQEQIFCNKISNFYFVSVINWKKNTNKQTDRPTDGQLDY